MTVVVERLVKVALGSSVALCITMQKGARLVPALPDSSAVQIIMTLTEGRLVPLMRDSLGTPTITTGMAIEWGKAPPVSLAARRQSSTNKAVPSL